MTDIDLLVVDPAHAVPANDAILDFGYRMVRPDEVVGIPSIATITRNLRSCATTVTAPSKFIRTCFRGSLVMR
ncbi:hypothetical protein GCM10020255_081720 [Rhodococcus baikonurensis]